MKVAVLIATQLKRKEMLQETIGSLVSQTRLPDQIIIQQAGTAYGKMNEAVRVSSCDAFVFVADDDLLAPTFLEETVKVMEETGCDCVSTNMQEFGEKDGVHVPYQKFPFITSLFRNTAWERVGGYDEDAGMYADALFGAKIYQGKHEHIDKPLFLYRCHGGQVTKTLNEITEYPKVQAKAKEYGINL